MDREGVGGLAALLCDMGFEFGWGDDMDLVSGVLWAIICGGVLLLPFCLLRVDGVYGVWEYFLSRSAYCGVTMHYFSFSFGWVGGLVWLVGVLHDERTDFTVWGRVLDWLAGSAGYLMLFL